MTPIQLVGYFELLRWMDEWSIAHLMHVVYYKANSFVWAIELAIVTMVLSALSRSGTYLRQ